MNGMTPRSRLAAALRCLPVDRPPWTIDLAYYNSAMSQQGKADARYQGVDGFLRQHEELGADPYLCYEAFWAHKAAYDGVTVETRRGGNERETILTLGGRTSLTKRSQYLPESFCWATCKHPVETPDDLELLLRILRNCRYAPSLDRHRELQEQWGERGLVAIGVPRTPIPALITEWCGILGATYLMLDAPELFAEVLNELDRLADPVYDALVEYAPVVVHFPDNISGEIVASFWDEHMAPVYRRRLDRLHAAGIICAIHNDGTVANILKRIAGTGFDGAEALTPKPVGDIELAQMRDLAGRDDFILWGMVPGAMFSRTWHEDAFCHHVEQVLDTCTGPMILGTADQVPPDGDIRRVKLASNILHKRYGADPPASSGSTTRSST